MENRTILAVFSIPILALAAVIVAVPALMPPGTYAGLDGTPGYMDHDWHDGLPSSLIYMLGDLFCHQEESRSFVMNGSQMAFCIRDMGLLIGLAVGLLTGSARVEDMTSRKVPVLALLMMAVTVVEWVAEHSLGDMPAWRFLSALVSGTGAGLFLSWMLCRGTVDTAGGR